MPLDTSRYLDLFVAESREHLVSAEDLTRSLCGTSPSETLRDLFRHAHSIKGVAGAMGYTAIVGLAQAAEDVLDLLRSGQVLDAGPYALPLRDAFACMARMVERAARGEPATDTAAKSVALRLRMAAARASSQTLRDRVLPSGAKPHASDLRVAAPRRTALPEGGWRLDVVLPDPKDPGGTARLMDALARLGTVQDASAPVLDPRSQPPVWRLAIQLASRLGGRELVLALAEIPEILSFVLRGDTPPGLETPPPPRATQWVRVRTETLDRLLEAARALVAQGGDTLSHTQLGRRILTESLDLRLERFDLCADRMEAVLSQVAGSLGKQARLEVEGRSVRLDRVALEALLETLPHLVRNALDHGIEPPGERVAAGKPAEGVIRVRVENLGSHVALTLDDDGRGMRLDAIRRSAAAMGAADGGTIEDLSDAQTLALLGRPGLTTASSVSSISGRGVGLDVVKSRVLGLGGTVDLSTEAGQGTRVTVRIPTPVATLDALLVRCAGTQYAIPRTSVVRVAGSRVWFASGDGESALVVDEIVGDREIAVDGGQAFVLEDGSTANLVAVPDLQAGTTADR